MSNSNLPTIQRIYADDFKNAPDWFRNEFIRTFNLFSQPIYNIVNQGVNVMENTLEEFYTFTITGSGSPQTDTFSFAPKKFIGKPNGVILCQCLLNVSPPQVLGAPAGFDWVYASGGMIQFLAIYGLVSGKSHTITVRIC